VPRILPNARRSLDQAEAAPPASRVLERGRGRASVVYLDGRSFENRIRYSDPALGRRRPIPLRTFDSARLARLGSCVVPPERIVYQTFTALVS
jgi:hypothetical protein